MNLVLGLGASSQATDAEISALIAQTLAEQGLSGDDVRMVASLDSRRPLLERLCAEQQWELVTHAALDGSVCESAAQQHGDLVVGKHRSAHATVAVARLP